MKKSLLSNSTIFFISLLIFYVILLTLQINQLPFERYPEWDHFWVDVRAAGALYSLKHALANFELPTLSPYLGFGWNLAGDHHSFWALPNILVTILSPRSVIIFCQFLALLAGVVGTFIYLYRISNNSALSIFGGVTYVSIPFTISLSYYYSSSWGFFFIPIFLTLIHLILENPSRKNLLGFFLLSAFSIGLCDIYFLIVITTVVPLYTLWVGILYHRISFLAALKKSSLLFLLCLLSGSFYIVPLLFNLMDIGVAVSAFKAAGIIPTNYIGLEGNFLQIFRELNGWDSLYLPIEGSALVLYIPAFFYFSILLALLFCDVLFKGKSRQLFLVLGLVILGLAMFFGSVIFYSPITAKLLPAFREAARGVLRLHLNLIPFVGILAAFICFSALDALTDKKIKIGLYALIFIFSLLVDGYLFNILPLDVERPYGSSNLIPVPIENPLHLIPFLNLSFIIILVFINILKSIDKPEIKYPFYTILVELILLISLLGISNYNEWFATGQQGRQPPLTRNSYRWDSYLQRKECIDKIIPRSDPNYRTLFSGQGLLVDYDGRNRNLIAETEMHVADKEKVLFSYREFEHPYTGLMRGTFKLGGKAFYRSNIMPPLSSEVPGNLDYLKLMGVKRIVSADAEISAEGITYRGRCQTAEGPAGLACHYQEGGIMYVYEITEPLGISFLVDNYKKVSQTDSLQTIFLKKEAPWINNLVFLEEDPPVKVESSIKNIQAQDTENRSVITQEKFNEVQIQVNAPHEKFLVLSYIFRPGWKGYIDSKKTKIYRAYGGFMALKVPPGKHTVLFRYSAYDIYLGHFLTLAAFLFSVFLRRIF